MYLEPYLLVSDRFGGLLHGQNCMIVTLAILRSSDPLHTLEWSKCKLGPRPFQFLYWSNFLDYFIIRSFRL